MAVSILFRTPTAQGFAVSGFTDEKGNLQQDVIATYVKDKSDTASKRYTYRCEGVGIRGTREVTIGKHHAGYGAPTELLKALGLNEDKSAAPVSHSIAELERMLREALAAESPAPKKRGRPARK